MGFFMPKIKNKTHKIDPLITIITSTYDIIKTSIIRQLERVKYE